MVKTLLVLGASGLTGYKAMQLGKSRFEMVGTYNIRNPLDKSLLKLDISKEDDLKRIFHDIKPDIVLNTTALHNVDYCESHPDEAFKINVEAVGKMVDLCNNLGSALVHLSTDFVFDGNKGNYSEEDSPNPLSVYAKSKLEGERQVTRCNSHLIIRTSVIYGWTPLETQGSTSSSGKPMNFALWALSKMSKNEELKIVNDQFTSPTLADVLAEATLSLAATTKIGLYHVSGTSCLSRYEFVRKIAATMGYPQDSIKSIDSKSLVQAAKRPRDSCLNCVKVQRELNYRLLNVDESLAVMRSQIEAENPALIK